MKGSIIIVGYSGHGVCVAESCIKSGIKLHGYAERFELGNNPLSLNYLGFEHDSSFKSAYSGFSVIIGIGDNKIRGEVANHLKSIGLTLVTQIDSSANVSSLVEIGVGAFLSRNCVVNSETKIGDNVIINTGAIIEHQCIIDECSHIAPAATICGNVNIGNHSMIGAGSVITPGIKVGNNSIIGAGSVIIKDVPDHEFWAGNPAKHVRNL
ncbi:MAG: NeuD/PglB/VioB family sugar acetyltransferase [Cyclobacteriaceae bacterium]